MLYWFWALIEDQHKVCNKINTFKLNELNKVRKVRILCILPYWWCLFCLQHKTSINWSTVEWWYLLHCLWVGDPRTSTIWYVLCFWKFSAIANEPEKGKSNIHWNYKIFLRFHYIWLSANGQYGNYLISHSIKNIISLYMSCDEETTLLFVNCQVLLQ